MSKIMFPSVIYQLNTKNEDNDQKIKYLTETHAKQIEDLKTSSIKNSSPPEDSIELSKVLLNFTGLIIGLSPYYLGYFLFENAKRNGNFTLS